MVVWLGGTPPKPSWKLILGLDRFGFGFERLVLLLLGSCASPRVHEPTSPRAHEPTSREDAQSVQIQALAAGARQVAMQAAQDQDVLPLSWGLWWFVGFFGGFLVGFWWFLCVCSAASFGLMYVWLFCVPVFRLVDAFCLLNGFAVLVWMFGCLLGCVLAGL